MIRYFKVPWFVRMWYSNYVWSIPSHKAIYITFDDGPHPEITPWVLDVLRTYHAKATFFCLGKNLEAFPQLGHQILAEGHQLANHTYSHLNGWKNANDIYIDDVKKGEEVLQAIGGRKGLFRPPYGRIRRGQARALGSRIIMWSHLSWDFDPQVSEALIIRQLKKAEAGSILVFHDSPKAWVNLKRILPKILSYFQSKGVKFEALS